MADGIYAHVSVKKIIIFPNYWLGIRLAILLKGKQAFCPFVIMNYNWLNPPLLNLPTHVNLSRFGDAEFFQNLEHQDWVEFSDMNDEPGPGRDWVLPLQIDRITQLLSQTIMFRQCFTAHWLMTASTTDQFHNKVSMKNSVPIRFVTNLLQIIQLIWNFNWAGRFPNRESE